MQRLLKTHLSKCAFCDHFAWTAKVNRNEHCACLKSTSGCRNLCFKSMPTFMSHPKLAVPNLHVIKALQSLTSKGYVTERFAWQHYYWYLTNTGIEYLRENLHLPQEIVPATLKKPTKPADARSKKSKKKIFSNFCSLLTNNFVICSRGSS